MALINTLATVYSGNCFEVKTYKLYFIHTYLQSTEFNKGNKVLEICTRVKNVYRYIIVMLKAGLHYQTFCDQSLSANTVLDEHQSNRRL